MATPAELTQAWKDSHNRKTLLGESSIDKDVLAPVINSFIDALRKFQEENKTNEKHDIYRYMNGHEAMYWAFEDEIERIRLRSHLRLLRHDVHHFHPDTVDYIIAVSQLRITEMEVVASHSCIRNHLVEFLHYPDFRKKIISAGEQFVHDIKNIDDIAPSVLEQYHARVMKYVRRSWVDGSYHSMIARDHVRIAANESERSTLSYNSEPDMSGYNPPKVNYDERSLERIADAAESMNQRDYIDSIFGR